MANPWNKARETWLESGLISESVSRWASKTFDANAKAFDALVEIADNEKKGQVNPNSLEEEKKQIKKEVKNKISDQENEIEDLALNPAISYKLQVSVPINLNYLMKAWAAAEGRDLSSIALQCLEIGLRDMKSKGGIPMSAVKRYDLACEKRIALAEIKEIFEKQSRLLSRE